MTTSSDALEPTHRERARCPWGIEAAPRCRADRLHLPETDHADDEQHCQQPMVGGPLPAPKDLRWRTPIGKTDRRCATVLSHVGHYFLLYGRTRGHSDRPAECPRDEQGSRRF